VILPEVDRAVPSRAWAGLLAPVFGLLPLAHRPPPRS
jgi:ABC-type phosphate/phosphonate transport system permease subunit